MEDEEIKYHEHDMVPVDKPAVKQAKTLCMFVLVVWAGCFWYYLQSSPATKAFVDAHDFWPCLIVGAVLVLFAIRAILS